MLCLVLPQRAAANCDAGERVLKLAGYFDAAHFARFRAEGLLRDTVNREMQGRLCLEILRDESTFKGTLGAKALQAGDADLVVSRYADIAKFSKSYLAFGLPFAFVGDDAVSGFLAKSKTQLNEELLKLGFQPMAHLLGRFEQMAGQTVLADAGSLAGKRLVAGDQIHFEQYTELVSATVQTVRPNGLLAAVKGGEVDVQMASWQKLSADGTAKVLGYVTETNHLFGGYQLLMSRTAWSNLPPKDAGQISEISNRIFRQVNFETSNKERGARLGLMRSGVVVNQLTRQQRKAWRDLVKPIWDESGLKEQPGLIDRLN